MNTVQEVNELKKTESMTVFQYHLNFGESQILNLQFRVNYALG